MKTAEDIKNWVETCKGATIEMGTPCGMVLLCSDKRAYDRAVAEGHCALSPSEILHACNVRPEEAYEWLRNVAAWKRAFAGTRVTG